jgi:predicted  nucleic acid-binding Zn-ribbon protein
VSTLNAQASTGNPSDPNADMKELRARSQKLQSESIRLTKEMQATEKLIDALRQRAINAVIRAERAGNQYSN